MLCPNCLGLLLLRLERQFGLHGSGRTCQAERSMSCLAAKCSSVGTAAVHCVHGRPYGHCGPARCILHAFVDNTQMYLHCHRPNESSFFV